MKDTSDTGADSASKFPDKVFLYLENKGIIWKIIWKKKM